jgi:serine-type D-Ala-D-Ala carboxypeptidase/endopeptidase (penicillin-binding protein 4)
MLYRKIQIIAVVVLASIAAIPVSSQTKSKKRTTSSATRKRAAARKKAATTRKAGARKVPAAPAVSSTAPRTVASLMSDMTSMAGRIRSGQFGIMAVSLTRGDTLFSENAGTPLMPASTMKMLTSTMAFERLGPNYRFSTDVLQDGTLSPDGTLSGNIYLRGDGDPSLSGRYLQGGPAAPMNFLADQMVARGVKHITGDVIGDATAFDDEKIPQGWLTRYLQAGYAARVSGLSLNENLVWVTVTADGAKLEPATTAIPLVSNVRTVPGGGASLSVRRQGDGTIIVSGRIGSSSPPRRFE